MLNLFELAILFHCGDPPVDGATLATHGEGSTRDKLCFATDRPPSRFHCEAIRKQCEGFQKQRAALAIDEPGLIFLEPRLNSLQLH